MEVKRIDYRSKNRDHDFFKSLKGTGFAVVTHHPIDHDLILKVYQEWQAYFASSEKDEHRYDPKTQAGFFPFGTEHAKDSNVEDLKEFYHYYPKYGLPESVNRYTPKLRTELNQLAQELLGWIEPFLPPDVREALSMPLKQMIEGSEETLFRPIHYPPLTGHEKQGAVRAGEHEDINLITLLPAATAPGLEVKDVFGDWHRVPCDMGNIVVNAGDMLKEATQNYMPSTPHRVVNPTHPQEALKPRYSMPLFLHPRKDVRLSKRHTQESFLHERLVEIGIRT